MKQLKLTKKQKIAFARIYVGSQMFLIDGGNVQIEYDLEDEDSHDNMTDIVDEINFLGLTILGKKPVLETSEAIFNHVKENY